MQPLGDINKDMQRREIFAGPRKRRAKLTQVGVGCPKRLAFPRAILSIFAVVLRTAHDDEHREATEGARGLQLPA